MNKNTPKYILIHCTDHPRSKIFDQFVSCNQWHKDRGFPISSKGLYIGYHRLITGDKNYECRADTDEGAHCNQQVNGVLLNVHSLGVCIGFDGDVEEMTAMEYALLQKQIFEWQDKYKITDDNVRFHRDFAVGKTCPGSIITKAWLKNLLVRPVVFQAPEKPVENMCIAQEKIIAEQKEKLAWYESIFQWIAERWS